MLIIFESGILSPTRSIISCLFFSFFLRLSQFPKAKQSKAKRSETRKPLQPSLAFLPSPFAVSRRVWGSARHGFTLSTPSIREGKMAQRVVSPEDVLESLMNDGTVDAIRMKVISQLKANHVGNVGGTPNVKAKLQPQRKKQPADTDANELPEIQAPASLPEIDLLDGVSLDPLLSGPETTVQNEPQEKETDEGEKVSVPVTSEEIQVNDASESVVQENTQNDERGQNPESIAEMENEDAPNLDEFFSFLHDDPVDEMDESNEDPTDVDYTVDEEDNEMVEAEVQADDGKKPSKRGKTGTTRTDANVDEELPKKGKKLSHRIRRKRRKVDPALLEMPEDEINPRQISIKNLILLAEAKEKKWNKEAAARSSNGDASSVPRRRGQEEFEFGDFEGNEEESGQPTSASQETFEPTVRKLNYHTYMNRSSSTRWTQSETELFYKGIRQFGTDFAMIQQLFPNRTRHQIKLKFKNEDKKYPTRIRDAITHRLTDNSQFEKVIEILEIEADKIVPEESQPSKAAHWKNEEEIDEAGENLETSDNDLDDSGKHESAPNDDDLETLFNWDNQQMEEEDFVF